MLWFLPLALFIGWISTREALWILRAPPRGNRAFPVFLMLGLGWFPLLAWIINAFWPQY